MSVFALSLCVAAAVGGVSLLCVASIETVTRRMSERREHQRRLATTPSQA